MFIAHSQGIICVYIYTYIYIHTCIYICTCIYILNDPMISRHRFFQVAFFSRVCFFQQSGPKNPMVFPWFSAKAPWPPRTCTDLLRHHWPCLPAPGPAPVTWSHGGQYWTDHLGHLGHLGMVYRTHKNGDLGGHQFFLLRNLTLKDLRQTPQISRCSAYIQAQNIWVSVSQPTNGKNAQQVIFGCIVTRQAICGIKSLEVGVCAQKALRWKGNLRKSNSKSNLQAQFLSSNQTEKPSLAFFLWSHWLWRYLMIFRYGSQGSPTKMDGFRPKKSPVLVDPIPSSPKVALCAKGLQFLAASWRPAVNNQILTIKMAIIDVELVHYFKHTQISIG